METLFNIILHYKGELFIIGISIISRLIELSKIKKKYKSIIEGLLSDLKRLQGGDGNGMK